MLLATKQFPLQQRERTEPPNDIIFLEPSPSAKMTLLSVVNKQFQERLEEMAASLHLTIIHYQSEIEGIVSALHAEAARSASLSVSIKISAGSTNKAVEFLKQVDALAKRFTSLQKIELTLEAE